MGHGRRLRRRIDWQSDPLGRTTTFDYTSIPGSTKVTDPQGDVVVNQYFGGQLAAKTVGYGTPQAATWRYSYDPVTSVQVQVVDPNGRITRSYHDEAGNATATIDPLGRVTTTTYNERSLPTATTDASGVTTTMSYDAAGNIRTRSTPLLDQSGNTIATRQTVYHYGETTPAYPGDVTSVTDPDGNVTKYRYDAFGNLIAKIAPPPVENPTGNTTTYGYNEATGWLTSTVSPAATLRVARRRTSGRHSNTTRSAASR